MHQMDIKDVQNVSSNRCKINILPSNPWNFSQIDHILGHKESLNKYKNLKSLLYLIRYNGIKLDINSKRCYSNHKPRETEQYTLAWPVGHRRNQGESLKSSKVKWTWKCSIPEPVGCSKGSSKREVYSYEHLHQTSYLLWYTLSS
jgi:hypothetical protein